MSCQAGPGFGLASEWVDNNNVESIEIVGDLLLGRYLRVVNGDGLVFILGRWLTVYCLDSSPVLYVLSCYYC